MKSRMFGLAVLASAALLAGGVGQASAVTCSGEVDTQGAKTLALAATNANLGTIASGCQIGPFSTHQGQNGTGIPSVDASKNPALYQFDWGGGLLSIQAEVGNNGIGYNIDFEIGLASGNSLAANNGLTNHSVLSTSILYQSGPTAPVYILQNINLAAGTYILDTYLGAHCSGCAEDPNSDPQYQVLFTPGAASSTPLPGSLALFGPALSGLGGLLAFRRRRRVA